MLTRITFYTGVLLMFLSCSKHQTISEQTENKPSEQTETTITAGGNPDNNTMESMSEVCSLPNCCGSTSAAYSPNRQHIGNGSVITSTSTTASVTVSAPSQYGNVVYLFPEGSCYTVSFQIRKFGNPYVAQIGIFSQTITATSSWQSYTVQSQNVQSSSAALHSIAIPGLYGGVEIRNFSVTRTYCTTTCPPSCEWEPVPITTSSLFRFEPTSTGTGSMSINSTSSVTFNAGINSSRNYFIDVPPGYIYKLSWSMSYTIPYGGGEGGVYPGLGMLEYYSTNNDCTGQPPGCAYGNVAENPNGIPIYWPGSTIFTNQFTNGILFRTSTTNNQSGSMTIYNFNLQRKCL